ncbi:MAG: hypothetical protein WD939_05155 [Dehalococcoidia bacterium]
MTDEIGLGSLKCVSVWSPVRSLRGLVRTALAGHVRIEDVHHLYSDVYLVYTDADPATIRDHIAPMLVGDESVVVVEFERWSAAGPAADQPWLLRRGH